MRAAFFDLDKTVIARPSLAAFAKTLYSRGFISRGALIKAAWNQLLFQQFGASHSKHESIRRTVQRIIKGWDSRRLEALVDETIGAVLTPIVYEEARQLIDEHRNNGCLVVIISSSPIEIVRPFAKSLGIDEAIATKAKLDSSGKYTGELEFYAFGEYKVDAVHELASKYGLDLAESYAYTDSHTDLPLLSAVGHPVAVNPDKELARVARDEGWQIVEFSHPVPILRQESERNFFVAKLLFGLLVVIGGAASVTIWLMLQRIRQLETQLGRR